jgi:3-hydroxyacyl-CoA dehydrogenase/enoyl-CoA hydratase/3-hydroxybutyryl-CoA epimerase
MSAADLPDTIRWQQDDDGIVVLVLDDPLQGANTMNDAYLASMGRTVERLVETKTEVRGVILTSAKKTFFAGGDLNEILTMDHGEAAVVLDRLRRIRYQLRTLETLGIPVVAAIAGAALGGGLEIAMSAHHRIALADRGVQLGYPEVTLGLLPGAGGVVRTVRLLGIAPALSELLLDGRRVEPAVGMELGIIDELVTAEEDLLPTAKRWIAANPRPAQPWDVDGFELPVGGLDQLAAEGVLLTLAAELRRRDPGGNYPAPRQIFAVAVEGAELEFDDASEIEARGFVSLATGQIAKNMIGAYFFDQQQVRSIKAGDGSERPPRLRGVELVGGGDARGHLADVFAGRGLEILRSAATNDPSLARIAIDRTLDSDREAAHAAGVTTLLVSAPGPVDPGAVGEAQLRFLGELESTPLIEVADRRRNSVAALNLALGVAKSLGKTVILTTGSRGC